MIRREVAVAHRHGDCLVAERLLHFLQRPSPLHQPGLRRAGGRRYSASRKVQLHEGQLLDDVRYALLRDPQYERPVGLRLLLADAKAPELTTRQSICEERPYDVVNLGQRSKDVLAVPGGVRLPFYVEQFREDFEALDEFRRHQPRPHRVMVVQRCGYERVEQTVRSLRPIYEQTAGLANLPRDGQGRAYAMMRSRFFRALNRRFNAADFWPEHVAGDLRERWFGPDDISAYGLILDDRDHDRLLEIDDAWVQPFVERDISSSQSQILAVFLGEPGLEALATDPTKKFKVWLAEQLWALHKRENILAPGYASPSDERLIAFIKELWMRWNYGGKFGQTVRSLARDPVTFGPGWNSNVFATGGVRRAESYWNRFLSGLPAWSNAVTTFLAACRYIGQHADPQRGLVFTDPLDGAEIQWNPVRRATKKLPAGEHYIEVQLPGVLWKRRRFIPRPWRVDTRDLARRVAPCVVHTLDAYFNALVLEYLAGRGLTQIIAVHDGWFVPASVEADLYDDDGVPLSGAQVLAHAITYVGAEWLSGVGRIPDPDKLLRYFTAVPPDETRPGLAVVYDWFADSLKGSPYDTFACEVRDRWRRRVPEQRWPQFTASGG
jgi:hypothetical protein